MCGHRFARLQHLRNHLTTHSSVGTFPYEICGAKSKTMDALRQHKKSHRAPGRTPDPPGQVGRPVQDQSNLPFAKAECPKKYLGKEKILDSFKHEEKVRSGHGHLSVLDASKQFLNNKSASGESMSPDLFGPQKHFFSKLSSIGCESSVNSIVNSEHPKQIISKLSNIQTENMPSNSIEHLALMRNYHRMYNNT